MEYAKDEIFKIKYNSTVDRLQIPRENWTSKLLHKIKKHKFISVVIMLFFMFSFINFFLIYNFVILLQDTNLNL